MDRDGQRIAGPRGHKAWALLGRLVRSSAPVSRRVLVEELFGEAEDPMGALRWTLAELRRRCGVPSAFSGDPVSLDLGTDIQIDVVEVGRTAVPDEIPEGRFLEGVEVRGSPGFESWLLVERHRVDGEVAEALRQAALKAMSARDFERAIALARAMAHRAPFDEGPHVLLVKALASSGDAAAALRQVEASEAMFLAEFGVAASTAIRSAARSGVASPLPGISARASAASLCEAGIAAVSAGAADAGIECLRAASAAAESSGDLELLSRCLTELGTALVHSVRGFDDEGAVILRTAADVAIGVGAAEIASTALCELSYVDLLAGRRQSASENLRAASDLSNSNPKLMAAIAGFEAMNLNDWGQLDASADRFAESVDLARSAGTRRREAWNLGLGARTMFLLGRLDDATEWAQKSCELADAERWRAFRPWPESWLAHARLTRGEDPAAVREDVGATFAFSQQIGDPCWEGLSAKTMGLTYLAEGDAQTALDWISNAGTLCRRVTDSYSWINTEILVAEATAALESGDSVRAGAAARQAIAAAAVGSMDELLARGVHLLELIDAPR